MNNVQSQVKFVAYLHILLGVLSLLGALVIGLFGAAIGAALGGIASGQAAGGVLGFVLGGGIVFVLVGVFAVPHFILAWGLLNGAEWARVVGIIVSILSLLHPVLGLGTAIAIYSLVVLFSAES